jgi:hypothetical protein
MRSFTLLNDYQKSDGMIDAENSNKYSLRVNDVVAF